jgi:16S rRNA processing protein RimM
MRPIGRVMGALGVRGQLRLMLFDPESDWLFLRERPVWLRSSGGEVRPVRLLARRQASGRTTGVATGVDDREMAQSLTGFEILALRADLPEPDAGSWYIRDLLGLPVATDTGRSLGVLFDVHQTATVDVWECRDGTTVWYIPSLKANILAVDATGVTVADASVLADDTEAHKSSGTARGTRKPR